ncbi:site-specific DNA-methyltransferase [Pectobacterium aroidearum]|uniref:DNA-methyltransferase n=1 Tax=Pectobacterium aroidearum TaxID=1201031 RepID=UPI00211448DA|nr:site-specific DNA-methyltransferase [Pectobacterium aroidearum]UUE37952.1 site-specific DNA-methyltransferase [Pectobacterium aroidearum]UUE42327.1 site-specific DNA-methyltransferase [Pectobacterium aroidearum]
MQNTVNLNSINIFNADSLEFIKTLPDNCIDLIATDPPYYKVKSNSWDNQWKTPQDYLAWLDVMFAEFWRILKPAGSLYVFCGWHLAANIELLMRERFNVRNHIIWAKPSGQWKKCHKEDFRAYFPATERIIFAEHYAGPYKPKGDAYAVKCSELKRNVLRPLIDYFRDARAALKVSSKDINAATGKQMASHWFSDSQWQLPSEVDYQKLQALFPRIAAERFQVSQLDKQHHALVDDYATLSRRYSELVAEYESLRRPFSVSALVPYTDVWTYPPVQFYPGKHPCEKPAEMMRDIIAASSRPGDVVADFFMGSGATIKAAMTLGRHALGVELEKERFEQTQEEIKALKTP